MQLKLSIGPGKFGEIWGNLAASPHLKLFSLKVTSAPTVLAE
jgi:hypothetical protein